MPWYLINNASKIVPCIGCINYYEINWKSLRHEQNVCLNYMDHVSQKSWIYVIVNHKTSDNPYNRYIEVIMSIMVSKFTGVSIVFLNVYWGIDKRKRQSSASLAGGFPSKGVSNAGNVSIWWCHNVMARAMLFIFELSQRIRFSLWAEIWTLYYFQIVL